MHYVFVMAFFTTGVIQLGKSAVKNKEAMYEKRDMQLPRQCETSLLLTDAVQLLPKYHRLEYLPFVWWRSDEWSV